MTRDCDQVVLDNVKAKKETARALLVELEDGRTIWVPQSQITDDSEVYAEGDEGALAVTAWFAEREGLE